MENVKVNVAARLYILETSGHKISLADVCVDLTKDQYERLQTSYQTNKYKIMNDDEAISDICNSIFEYYGAEDLDLEDDQKLIVSYPIEITNGLSFTDLPQR